MMTFAGTIRDLNHAKICARLRRRHQPWLMRWGLLVAVVVYFTALFGLLTVANATSARLPGWSSYLPFAAFVAALIALMIWRRRHVWDSVRDAPVRQAVQHYDLSEDGLRVTGELSETLIRWPGVLEVIEDPEGLLFLTGQMEYIAIPKSAFLETDMQTARAQCLEWIEAAKART
ncbi:YcxB family protein [Mameliella alba]|nr:YcxB family protein [Antarctobacter heliothermus]MBY6145380.1 YcxB family protein [Mameliella alba]MCA0955128.1 YcxB family protein [Mameliella alba]